MGKVVGSTEISTLAVCSKFFRVPDIMIIKSTGGCLWKKVREVRNRVYWEEVEEYLRGRWEFFLCFCMSTITQTCSKYSYHTTARVYVFQFRNPLSGHRRIVDNSARIVPPFTPVNQCPASV